MKIFYAIVIGFRKNAFTENLNLLERSWSEKFNQSFRKYESGSLFHALSFYKGTAWANIKYQYFEHYKVMLGSVGNIVESVKFIGRRDMNMNANLRKIFNETDKYHYYPYFNDAKEL